MNDLMIALNVKTVNKSRYGVYENKPNLCVVHRVCSYCLGNNVNASSTCDTCGKNEIIFSGPNTNDEFCQWLFSGENNGATVLCHNFKGYDSFPILSYLFRNGILPKIIPSGAKNMSVEIPACNIRMIDSLNFLPSALSKLPKMFGLDELQKGYFPHLFNRQENQSVVLEHLPDIKYYNPDGMKVDDREIFLEWYAANVHKKFDFKLELLKYCQSDVDILRRCCLKFRRLFMAMTTIDSNKDGIDPFEKCITIASACNLVFRNNFLRPETIGIIPAQGYNPEEKHSIKALKWLRYVSKSKGIHIQHARNGGEKYIGDYRVDGYHKSEDGEEIVFEYHGCFSGMGVQNSVNYVNPLEPRNAFSGGRTEAFKLYHEAKDGEQIKYYDVTSLYPFINKTGKVVLGHPTIITENFDDISKYEGLIKCCVQPPHGLHIPVLPAKINNKLMFSLCRTCTELQQTTTCLHTNTERAITGTWVTDELKMAINKGFWGKFGQRTNLPQVEYVSDPSVYFDMLTSDQQEVTCVNFVTDEMIEMRWRNKEEFIEVSGRTNVVIAAYTTAQARLKRYSYLDKLGDRVLYADTDSVIFTAKQGEWEPPLGDYL
ncbi:uncharacterized protein LOC134700765 [Mytilus trossulus]|uniref:uncharacterized protein LOC134700765 n=1 Tax=Mytilus trossulus TaxID=6551 RepID=UPI0030051245